MGNFRYYIYDFLVDKGVSEGLATYINIAVLLIILFIVVFVIDYVTRRILWKISTVIANRTRTAFDDYLLTNKLPRNVAHVIPLIILIELLPSIFSNFPYFSNVVQKTLSIAAVLLAISVFKSVLMSIRAYLKTLPKYKDKPIYSYIQVIMIFVWLTAIFAVFSIIANITVFEFLGTIGAASAIVILIFRDSILGFVASIHVTINDMVKIGDWITFDKYGADGDVIEITLATVKVQNWDKTITTIPTYALVSESFKNWRGMTASGGRRIKRSVIIKATTIKFLTSEDIEKFKKIELIKNYLDTKEKEIQIHNNKIGANKALLINGRNLTNFGVFRKYLQSYMEQHSALHKNMTLMVRQLEPTPQGIPMEIYAFSKDIVWQNYEYIMADIFDHILASITFFDLEIYELTGTKIN